TFGPQPGTPVVTTTSGNLTYSPGQAAVAIDPGVTVTDSDDSQLTSASVAITGGFAQGQDVLGFTPLPGIPITGSYNASTGVLTLRGPTSVANFQSALRAVTSHTPSPPPGISPRTITLPATDPGILPCTGPRPTAIGPQPGVPVVVTTIGNLVYTHGQGAVQ